MDSLHRPSAITAAALCAALGFFACGLLVVTRSAAETPATTPLAPSDEVQIVDRIYQPSALTVETGQSVLWHNTTLQPHTVTALGGEFDSGPLSGGESFSVMFTNPGTFAYKCTIHPTMHGVVTVLAPGSPGLDPRLTITRGHGAHEVALSAPRPDATALVQLTPSHGRTSWHTVATTHLNAQGKANLKLAGKLHGRLRISIPATDGLPALRSRTVSLPTLS
jgi:plastocyanin